VERKSKDDPIFDERKVMNNAIDYQTSDFVKKATTLFHVKEVFLSI